VKAGLRLMPWALVYIRLMVKMPGGNKCLHAVSDFVVRNGLEFISSEVPK
jgi:hypothetical protein